MNFEKLVRQFFRRQPNVYGGWHFCYGSLDKPHQQTIVENGKLCPICGKGKEDNQ